MGLLKWPGAKWSLGYQIAALFPEHRIYIDAFFGSGAAFFCKEPSNTEILNDLDGDITNFFTCVRDRPEELAAMVELTPYSRAEYKRSYDREGCTDIERARRFFGPVQHGKGGNAALFYSVETRWPGTGSIL